MTGTKKYKYVCLNKVSEPEYSGTAKTRDEIKTRNSIIFHNRVVANNMTLQQLGTMFNITRERVRQIQNKEVSIKKLNQQPKEIYANHT